MFTDPIQFYFVKSGTRPTQEGDLTIIMNQLGTYAESYFKLKKDDNSLTIDYNDSPMHSVLNFKPKPTLSDSVISSQMTLTCEKMDNTSVGLLKGIVKSMGYRIFNPSIEAFISVDPNLMDLTTIKLDEKIKRIFEIKKLEPVYQIINSLVFYAKDTKDGSIHLVNKHLIQSAIEVRIDIKKAKNFSVKIAPDISTFIALTDRGIAPIEFYKTLFNQKNKKLLEANLSGFSSKVAEEDLYISPVFFYLDRNTQSFISLNKKKSITIKDKIKKGESIEEHVMDIVKKHQIEPLLAIKYPYSIEYETEINGDILPRLNLSIFVDEQ